jgi:pyridoxine 5-phosphate synthase
MSRLALNIDPIALIRNTFTKDIPDPAHMVVLAEMGGAESIVCHLREDLKTVNERDVRVMLEVSKTHLNVRCDVNAEIIRKMLTMKPDMITFVATNAKTALEAMPVDLETYADAISNLTADLRANDILSSVLINPDINLVKIASRLELDYIELNTQYYTAAESLDQQISEMEEINNVALAANKLGLGVNASGGLNQENLKELANINYLEDLVVGDAIAVKSLAIGFEHAVRDFASLI